MASIRKEGKYYKLYYRDGKRLRKKSLRTTSKREAERLLRKFEYELESRRQQGKNSHLIEKRLAGFLEEAEAYSRIHKSPQTVKRELRIYKNFLGFFGDLKLKEINFRKIESYIEYLLLNRGFQKNSINIELRHLSAAFSVAVKYEYIAKNPFKGIAKLKVPKKKPIFLTSEQAKQLLVVAKDRSIYTHIFIALSIGARSGEVISLEWKNVDLDNGLIKLFGKGSKERTVPIPQKLKSYLASLPDKTGFVVKTCRTVDGVSKRFRVIADLAGLPDFTFHNLRDTYASWLVQQGVSLKVIQDLLGHESIQTTLIYAHLAPDSRFVAAEMIDQKLRTP